MKPDQRVEVIGGWYRTMRGKLLLTVDDSESWTVKLDAFTFPVTIRTEFLRVIE